MTDLEFVFHEKDRLDRPMDPAAERGRRGASVAHTGLETLVHGRFPERCPGLWICRPDGAKKLSRRGDPDLAQDNRNGTRQHSPGPWSPTLSHVEKSGRTMDRSLMGAVKQCSGMWLCDMDGCFCLLLNG